MKQKQILEVIRPKRRYSLILIWVSVVCMGIVGGVFYNVNYLQKQPKVRYLTIKPMCGDIQVQISAHRRTLSAQ